MYCILQIINITSSIINCINIINWFKKYYYNNDDDFKYITILEENILQY